VTGGSARQDACDPVNGYPFCQFDYLTLGYDAASGAELWRARYGEESPDSVGCQPNVSCYPYNFDVPWYWGPIVVSPDGSRVFVAGSTTSSSPQNVATRAVIRHDTVAYDSATGKEMWVNRFVPISERYEPITYIPYGEVIAESPDGRELYVAADGYGEMDSTGIDAKTGTQLWIARYKDGLSGADAVVVSPDGSRLFVGGFAGAECIPFFCATWSDIEVVAYDTP
jgi:outer membrane protein assembly factor BamB